MILIFEEIIYKNFFFFLYNIKYFFNSYIMFQIVNLFWMIDYFVESSK